MSVIGLAEIAIAPEVSGFAAELKNKVGEAMKNPLAVAGAAVTAVGATVGAFAKSSVDKFKDVAGEVKQLTSATGGSVESMSRLRFAAEETGVSTDSLGTGLKKLGLNVVNNSAQFDKLGIKVKDSRGQLLPMDQTLGNVANKFKTMPNGVEKNALAIQLFGKQGTDLIPILNKGKDGLSELGAQADKFGLTLTQGNLDAIRKNAAAHRELQAAMDGLKVQVGAQLMPVIASLAAFLVDKAVPAIISITDLVRGRFGPDISAAVGDVKKAFDDFMGGFENPDAKISPSVDKVTAIFISLGAIAKQIFDDGVIAWGSFVDGFKSSDAVGAEVGPLATAFAAVGVAVSDSLKVLGNIMQFLLAHKQTVIDVTVVVLALKAAYEGWQLTTKTISFVTSGVDKVMGVIDSVSGALGKIGSKTIDIAAKATGGAAQGAGNAAGNAVTGQVGNVVSGAAGGALGNFFDLKALLPKIQAFATGIVTAIGVAIAGVFEGVSLAAVIVPALIVVAVAGVAALAFYFRDGILNFFTTDLPNALGQLPSLAATLVNKGLELLAGLLQGVETGFVDVGKFFIDLPNLIAYSIGFVAGTLFKIGSDLIQGLWDGAKFVFELVKGWVSDIPNVATSLLDLVATLTQKGQDLITGFFGGITGFFSGSVTPWFSALPGEIVGIVGDVTHTLWQIGSDIIGGLWSAIQLAWNDPKRFFTDLVIAVPAAVGFAGNWLYEHGRQIITGLKSGIENLYDSAISKFRDLRGNVLGAVTGAATWLLEAGKDVIRGLISGIDQVGSGIYNKLKGLGQSVIDGFKKGAGISSPSRLMHESGMYLMQGLANGIDSGKQLALDAISDVAGSVLDPFAGAQMAGLPSGVGRSAIGGRVTHIGAIHISNSKTLQENLDDIDRLYPVIPA